MGRTRRTGIAAIAVMLVWGAVAAFPEATEEFNKTYALRDGTPVRISNVSGRVEISTWDRPEAEVRAVKRATRHRDDLARVRIEVRSDGVLNIETKYDRTGGNDTFLSRLFGCSGSSPQVSVDYTIRIPRSSILERVNTTSADVDLRDVRGDGTIRTVSGGVTIAGAQGVFDIQTVSGDVRMDGGALRNIQTVSGNVRLRGIRGQFDANSTSGDLQIDGTGGPVNVHTVSGTIRLAGPAAGEISSISGDIEAAPSGLRSDARFSTVSGDIRLRLPAKVNTELVLETVSGELVNRSGQAFTATQISRKRLAGRIGSGGGMLSLHTTSGDVTLE